MNSRRKYAAVLWIMALVLMSVVFPAAAQASCDSQVSTPPELADAITRANDETACAGHNTITVMSNLDVASPASNDNFAGQGASAFPVITSSITIHSGAADGSRVVISRAAGAPAFRFFLVDGRTASGRLTLGHVELTGGAAQKGAAIFVAGSPDALSADALLNVSNSVIRSNVAANDAGAIHIDGTANTTARVLVSHSTIEGNSAEQGGAIYNDARSNGTVILELLNTRIASNQARKEGGAIYNNTVGGRSITIEATNTDFIQNTQGTGGVQCYDNGANININSSNRSTDGSCGQAAPITEDEAAQILATPLAAEQPPAAGGVIAFHTNRDGDYEIYSVAADGSALTRLTTNTAHDAEPAFSSDGSRIAFTTDRDGNAEIYTMAADGSDLVRVTNHESGDIEAVYSPDGTNIVFRSNRDGNWEIYSIPAAGGDAVRLTSTGADEVDPAYSPDGTRLVFGSLRDGNYEIYTMAVDGSDAVRVTNNGAADVQPSYSPDGTRIVFRSDMDGNSEIYTMNVDGSDVIRLTNNSADDGLAAYSTDGKQIAFASDQTGNYDIFTMNVDGSGLTNITNNEAADLYATYAHAPVASVETEMPVLGTGEVQVTLTWDNQSDMDLEVTEPNGETIRHDHTQSSTGGLLDVDSNYPCGSNTSGVENIFWPDNAAPSGSYTVRVNLFDTCGAGTTANWTLTVRVRGEVVLTQTGTGNAEFNFNV